MTSWRDDPPSTYPRELSPPVQSPDTPERGTGPRKGGSQGCIFWIQLRFGSLTKNEDQQCRLLFGKEARAFNSELRRRWGGAHIHSREHKATSGTAVQRVTRETCLPAEVLEAARGVCSRLAVLPATVAHLGRWGGPRSPSFSGFTDSE